jgi:competence protein ComEC
VFVLCSARGKVAPRGAQLGGGAACTEDKMLRIHFLNVGHGDCTIIEHPSGRLTMIDINNSQEYDPDTFKEIVEERRRARAAEAVLGAYTFNSLTGSVASDLGLYTDTYEAAKTARDEITDPVAFMHARFPGRKLWRFILTHPDLDHMRGLKRLHEEIGFDNFWDTANTKVTPTFQNDADREDWEYYQTLRAQSKRYHRGDQWFAFAKHQDGSLEEMESKSCHPRLS